MDEILLFGAVFLVGIVTGFLDSAIGSGGLVAIPSLIFLGLPPQVAIATDRLGSIGQTGAAIFKFFRSAKIRWNFVPYFIAISLVGTAIGANILLTIDTEVLQKIIGILLILLLPVALVRKDLGIKRHEVNALKKGIGFAIYFFLTILNGFLGLGVGVSSYYNSLFFFGFTLLEANATGTIPWFLLSLFSLFIYTSGGIVDYTNGAFLFIGMTLGGYLGAHVALKKGEQWVKRLFVLVVVASAIRLLFFS